MKKTTQYIATAALFLVPLFALLPSPFWPFNSIDSFFFPFISGKGFYFRILVEIAFASWIILAFLDAKYRPRLNALTVGVTVFALVTLVADLLGVNPLRSLWSNFERMEGWIIIAHLWMFFITMTSLFGTSAEGTERSEVWYRWLHTSLIVAFIVGIYGLFQILGWAAIHQGSTRIDASLGNAIYMAVYMLFHAFISAYFFFVEKAKGISASKIKLWLYSLFAVFASFLLFETATRGTILGLIGGIMLALFLYAVLGKNESKKSRWVAGGLIGVIILIGIVFWLNRDAQFIKDSEVLNRLASISISDTKTQARGYVWPMALEGWTQRPILGWGQENFNYVFNTNYNPLMWRHEQWFDRAHNIYLDWLINAGAVGLLAYLALYILSLMAIWKSGTPLKEKCVLTGLMAGYAVHNVFVFDNLASYVFFFAMLGFVSSMHGSNKVAPSLREGATLGGLEIIVGGNREFSSEIVEYIVAPVSIIVLIFSLYFFNIRAIQANTTLITALQSCNGPTPDVTLFGKALAVNVSVANQEIREQILSCAGNIIQNQNVPGTTKQAFFTLAMKGIENQIASAPKDARMYVLGGVFLNSAGQLDKAQPILEEAHKLTPTKQTVDFQLAMNYFNTGKVKEGVQILKEAYESDTTNTTAQSTYAIGLIIDGKEAEAKTIFKDTPSVYENAQVAQVYAQMKQYDKSIALYRKLITADSKNIQLRMTLAQVQYTAGMKSRAIETLQSIAKDFPEYKDQVEAAIKEAQK